MTIQGPGIGPGINRAVVNSDSDSDCEFSSSPPAVFHLHANGVTLKGLEILDDCEGSEHLVHVGGVTEAFHIAGVTVEGNDIHGGRNGVTISWGSTPNSQSPNKILNNIIRNNNVGVFLNAASNNIVEGNTINDNSSSGILFDQCPEGEGACGFGPPSGNKILSNTILRNRGSGIKVILGSGNEAHLNTISQNGSGVNNQVTSSIFDASKNFWGAGSGPNHITNSGGTGQNIVGNVKYRPFYTDSARTTVSSSTVAATAFNPATFFTSGVFSLPSGTTSQTSTPSITINQETSFTAPAGAGISSVKLPFGVVIQRVGGGTINASLLSVANTLPSALAGFTSGTAIDGALQWGIPNLGLEFTQAITLQIFVGTSFNGQTLNVVRSTTGTGGWTSGGIVAPGTCVVASGLCTFQATLASFFATNRTISVATSTSSSSSSGGGGDGGDGLGCAVHDCSVHPAPQNLVLGVSAPAPAAGFAPGILAVTSEQAKPSGEIKAESTTSAVQPAVTVQPQTAGQSPFNVKAIAIVVIILLLGFGAFRLLVK